jgi:DEAD/DEAH box helicase domain-containing protein
MTPLDALSLDESLRDRLVNFSTDEHFVRDPKLRAIARAIWAGPPVEGGLAGDLWVESSPPAQASRHRLDDLVEGGRFDRWLRDQLAQAKAVPGDRLLYEHQLRAIEEAKSADGERPTLVVTAPTGAGKTESFLLPVLDDLATTPRSEDRRGIRSLILYPMNALVNDQVDRLHSWLRGQDRLTLFHFTSETPEDDKAASDLGQPPHDRSRMRTRQQARGREDHAGRKITDDRPIGPQPDLLITNYSMLEYMLCRPQDGIFFGPSLRSIVLDEAHLYTGTLAAEMTFLLRRVLTRCGLDPSAVLQVATSATLGSGDEAELARFASTIFTKPPGLVRVIVGRSTRNPMADPHPPTNEPEPGSIADRPWLSGPTILANSTGDPQLNHDPEACQSLAEDLRTVVGGNVVDSALVLCKGFPAIFLRRTLIHAPVIHRIDDALHARRHRRLSDLAADIWGRSDDRTIRATIKLLQAAAAAREGAGDYPILPHRLHALVRPAEGLIICLNASCSGDPERKLDGLGQVWPGTADLCAACGSATMSLFRCGNCGDRGLAAVEKDGQYRPAPPWSVGDVHRLATSAIGDDKPIGVDPASGRRRPSGTRKLWPAEHCPTCEASTKREWGPFASGAPLALSIVAESLLAGLPEYPSPDAAFRPARGRRLLAFSDSRSEAARLGPRLTRQHEIQVARAAIARFVEAGGASADAATLAHHRKSESRLLEDLSAADLTDTLRETLERDLSALKAKIIDAERGGTIAEWTNSIGKRAVSRRILRELLDADQGERHQARDWTLEEWDRNTESVLKTLPTLMGRELAARPRGGRISLETTGLVEVAYPGLETIAADDGLVGRLSKGESREKLRTAWPGFLAAICDSIRTDGAVTLGEDGDREYPLGPELVGRWCAEASDGPRLFRLIGDTERQALRQIRLRFAQAVLEAAGLPTAEAKEKAPDLLRSAFAMLHEAALPWLEREQRPAEKGSVPAIRIVFDKLGLKRPVMLFRCEATGHVWPRSVLGCAPEAGCTTLHTVDHATLDDDPRLGRYRREFKTSPVFTEGLWAEEHSAQLENRRLQDLFRAGVRNVLSSTTTLELGIDIGGLSGVLMANVPPGKANYLQRAGRAGRRADGSSIVVTFARPRPFDHEVFKDLGRYLGRDLRSPRVFLERERLGLRHAHAFILGEFFREVQVAGQRVGAMRAYGTMGGFCGVGRPSYWEAGEPRPPVRTGDGGLVVGLLNFLDREADLGIESRLVGPLHEVLASSPAFSRLDAWPEFLGEVRARFDAAIREWQGEYDSVLEAWSAIVGDDRTSRARATALRYQLKTLADTTVIETLGDRQVLPRYGFPIGMLRLRVAVPKADRKGRDRVREEDQFRLERGGLLALREYAPGAKLLVGGKIVTSRGLMKHWTGANLDGAFGLRGIGSECVNKHFSYRIDSGDPPEECPICGGASDGPPRPLILPRHGFTSAAWDPPRRGTEVESAGGVERATISFAKGQATTARIDGYAGITGLVARYREDGEILVYHTGENKEGFAICTKCGYADSEPARKPGQEAKGSINLPKGFDKHSSLDATDERYFCWRLGESPSIRRQTLAARETTDVLLLDFDDCLPRAVDGDDGPDALIETLARALIASGSKRLDIDTRELGGFALGRGVVLYDNVPGGAGHVGELFERGREGDRGRSWLEETRTMLRGDDTHHARCETACLDCLLTFDAQDIMSRGLLRRRDALHALDAMLEEIG